MATLPNALALSGWPVDSSPMVAAPGRTDLASIQTAMNSLLATLGGGTAAQVLLSGGGTTVSWGGAYSSYTPTWGATGVAPATGNGTLVGRYLQIGKFVHYTISLTMGSTTTFGTGEWFFSLPVASSAGITVPVGQTYLYDTSAGAATQATARMLGGAVCCRYPATWPNGVETGATNATPFTWATTDILAFSGVYEAT